MAISRVEPTSSDQGARRRDVDDAMHSARMEGLQVTPEWEADAEEYVSGRTDLDEFGARTRSRYGVAR